MKKLILLIAAAATLLVGCDKENNIPLEEQIIGKWVVTEYLDTQTNTYKSVAGTANDGYYAQLNADKTFVSDGFSGTYVIKNRTIECAYSTDSKLYIDMIELNGNNAILDYYYSPSVVKTRFKARKQ